MGFYQSVPFESDCEKKRKRMDGTVPAAWRWDLNGLPPIGGYII